MILLCGTLAACSTRQTPRTVNDYCLIYSPIPYTLVPKAEREAAANEGRPVRDDGNVATDAPTVERIGARNQQWRELCEIAR